VLAPCPDPCTPAGRSLSFSSRTFSLSLSLSLSLARARALSLSLLQVPVERATHSSKYLNNVILLTPSLGATTTDVDALVTALDETLSYVTPRHTPMCSLHTECVLAGSPVVHLSKPEPVPSPSPSSGSAAASPRRS
jgi:hypothetical protein